MSDLIKVDVSRSKAAAVSKAHGVTPPELRDIQPRIDALHKILRKERKDGVYGFWDLHKDKKTLAEVKKHAAHFLGFGYDNLVILGIGGSALGTSALATALLPPYYNLLTKRQRKGHPRLFVMDNIDPVTFRGMMRLCRPEKTLYCLISKSGGTAETMSQAMIVVDALEKKVGKAKLKDHLVVITNPRDKGVKSHLHTVTNEYKLTEMYVPLNVGGRFSVFSPVGLFPAAVLGMDVDEMFAGCALMDKACQGADLATNPAYLRATIHYLLDTEKGKVMSVMMPYADGLKDIADWYRQLWAESLGKRYSLDGEEVFAGQTPVAALGATDQHSQIQLYREGPNDKIITILEARRFERSLRIPDALTRVKELDYLRGTTMNKLMSAELRGTMDALKVSQRPVIRVTLPRVNANTVAQLLYMLEVETAMAGRLYNINTYDQPGVEEGKIIARQLMGGKG